VHFTPTEDQALIKASVERCIAGGEDRRNARGAAPGYSAANWQRLADAGVPGLAVSAASGGMGDDRIALLMAMEALGRGLSTEPMLEMAVIAGGLLDAAGDAAQQATVLEPLLQGKRSVALAHFERNARFNRDHVETQVVRRRGRLFLEGGKVAVRPGLADTLIISAREDDGIGFWLVPGAAEAMDRRSYRIADGSVAAELVLRGVEVLPGARLAGGFEALGPVVATARAAAAAEMLGLMTLLFDATLAYVKTRHQFGQPIGNFQVIQHRLAESYVKLEQSRSQVVRAGLASPCTFAAAAAGAFAYVAEAAIAMGHTAVQLHGGMGITDELDVGHALKRIRVLATTFGDATTALDEFRRAA
jgi:alkylation response protein AidB-like acyl-CoA dehydrogenase